MTELFYPHHEIELVERRIAEACRRAGRPRQQVTLIAVSKLQPEAKIRQAFAAGLRDFGENYAQELRDKAVALSDCPGLRLHAIGTLQRNKVKYVAQFASSFHALCDLSIAQALSARRLANPLPVFLEVNLARQTTKGGVSPEQIEALADPVRKLPGLQLVGLMTMPPMSSAGDGLPDQNRPYFAKLRKLGESLGLSELSMGTTGDFEVAIEEGATVVRVGRSIFGERS